MDIKELLQYAIQEQASDVHFTVGSAPTLRVGGRIVPYGNVKCMPDTTEAIARVLMQQDHIMKTFLAKGEADFSFSIGGLSRFRVSIYKQRGSVAISIRVIPNAIPKMEALRLPKILKDIVVRSQGLILVTGPTGSGKSTTLASIIDYVNKNFAKRIITLEDPIEYLHRHDKCTIDQREIGTDVDSFASGLRASLRQDPDIILVGEMRDLDTVQTAVSAAETGHLVFATLHTNDAPSTVERIIDFFPATQQKQIRTQLSGSLTAVLSQRLLPREDTTGRVASYELMLNTSAVASLIRNEETYQLKSVIATSRKLGMISMEQDLTFLVSRGFVSLENARHIIPDLMTTTT